MIKAFMSFSFPIKTKLKKLEKSLGFKRFPPVSTTPTATGVFFFFFKSF